MSRTIHMTEKQFSKIEKIFSYKNLKERKPIQQINSFEISFNNFDEEKYRFNKLNDQCGWYINSKNRKKILKRYEKWATQSFYYQICFGSISSTSVPGGNQVDGLPPASSLEKIKIFWKVSFSKNHEAFFSFLLCLYQSKRRANIALWIWLPQESVKFRIGPRKSHAGAKMTMFLKK